MEKIESNISSDNLLLLQLKKENHSAFNKIYSKYWDRLYTFAFNFLNDKQLSEDILHDIFTQLWIKRNKLEIENLSAYLYKAVRNNSLLKLKNNYKLTELHESHIYKLTLPSVDQSLAEEDLLSKLKMITSALPKRCKEIFYKSRLEQYSISEIAKHYNISHRTVENQLHIALKHVRSSLGKNIISILLLLYF